MTGDDMPTLGTITRRDGVAGQVSFTVPVTYPGEETRTVTFVGSTYGGPVVMVTDMAQVFVSTPDRFGTFSRAWVRRFFGGAA